MEEFIKSKQIAYKKCNSSLKIMKVSILMLFICIFSLTAENVYTQQKELSLELRNVNIIKAISEIEKKSDYVFLITDEARTELKKKISVSVNRESIQDILGTILKGTDLGYSVVERQVSLYKNPESSVSNAAAAIVEEIEQQKKRIAGKVVDNEGVPVIGANIVEEGTSNGTVTNADGSFSLSVEENATLIISYIGYVTQNIPTSDKTTINIILKEDTEALEEVVVVGYGTQRKVNLTGAVGVVSGEDITSKATTDALSAIQGQLSGVTVLRSSGKPGSETGGTSAIRIRGFSSSNEAHALVLIDGVEGDLESLNPGDIESISVLKDAASASIYGARAAAGVILVTTKKGVEQRAKVSYSGSFGINTPGDMPKRIPVWEEIEIVNLLRMNNSGTPARNQEHTSWMSNPNINYTPNGARYTFQGNANWIKEGLNEYSSQQNHSVSVNGGSEKTKYFISCGLHIKNGLLKYGPDDFTRTNLRASLNNEINNYVDFNINVSYEGTVQKENPYGAENIFGLLYNNLGWQTIKLPEYDTNYNVNPWNTDYQRNPIRIMKEGGVNSRQHQYVSGIATFRVKNVVEGLTLDMNISRRAGFIKEDGEHPLLFSNGRNGSERPAYHVNNPQNTDKIRSTNYQDKLEALLNYDLRANYHHVHVLAGASYEEYLNDLIRGIARNGVSNNFFSFNFYDNSLATNSVLSDAIQPWKMASLFGRVNYDYADRYLLEATLRYDGSSRLAPGNRWEIFPSISAGWRLSEESFFESARKNVNNLKLRASWGQLGNSTVLNNDYYPYIGLVNSSTYFGNPYYYQNQMVSADITWETVTSTNIGLDMGFLNNRLNVTGDYYWKKNDNMLSQATLGNLNGYAQNRLPYENVGILKVWGWEVSAEWRDKIGDVSYRIGISVDDSQNELVKYQGANTIGAATLERLEGYPLKTIWGYQTNGFWSSRQEYLDYKAANPGYESYDWDARLDGGDVRYVAQGNPDHRIGVGGGTPEDPGDLIYLGTENPRYLYAINMGLQWKGFDFSMFWQGVGKRKYVVNNEIFYPVNYDHRPHSELIRLGYWTEETPNAYFARLVEYQTYNYQVSDRWIQNGAYIRLKNIQLGYTIPVPANILQSLRVYITGNDVWEYSKAKFKALDPEVSNNKNRNYYPFFRTWSMGVNLTF
jgi:TonB-linked SusC/RagA family outer membrane protein